MSTNPLFIPAIACPICWSNVRNGDHGDTRDCPLCTPEPERDETT